MMTGLGFLHPWLLAGLAALGLPLLIHYLTRARPRRIRYPPYRLLREACAGRQAVYRLREWLLLALRCLAVGALVLLFSRPFWRAASAGQPAGAGQRVVLVLDASLSMTAVQDGVALFTRAQTEASDVLRTLPGNSVASVILVASQPRELLPALSRNLAALHDELVKAQPTYEVGNAAAAIERAGQLLAGDGTAYVFSDFQSNNWHQVRLPGAAGAAGIRWRLRPVARRPVANAGLTALQLSPNDPVVGEPVELRCTVFNASAQQREETVRLQLESVTQDTGVSVPPYSARTARFQFSLAQTGSFPGKVALGGDDLAADDTRWFVVNVRDETRALVVSDSEPTDRRSAAFFVATALSPSPAATPGLRVERRQPPDLDQHALETAATFVLVAPVTLPGETAALIARRVEDGAALICLLDGPTSPGLIGALAAASNAALSPAFELGAVLTGRDGPTARLMPAANPRLFAELAVEDLRVLEWTRHYRTRPLVGRDGEVLLAYDDGSAALSLVTVGRGAAIFANLPATPDAGNLVGSPLFPSLLQELWRLLRRSAEPVVTTPGQPWVLEAPMTADYIVTGPRGGRIAATTVASGRTMRLAMPPATALGLYQVRQGARLVTAGAVNADPRETDTRAVDLAGWTAAAGQPSGHVTVLTAEGDLARTETTRPLWPWCAGTAAGALALEMLLLALWGKRPVRLGAST